jgi:putative membrane protein insertion efficiency factor
MTILFIIPIRFYRYVISPVLGPRCRFFPSCSEYAEDAFKAHGALAGSYLTAHRLLRCHPFCKGGLDPVPENFSFFSRKAQL